MPARSTATRAGTEIAPDAPAHLRAERRTALHDVWMLQLIANAGFDLLSVQNGNDEFVYASTTTQTFGWRTSDYIGQSLRDFVHPDDLQLVMSERASDSGVEARIRCRFKCRSGDYRWVELRSRLSAQPTYIVTVVRDIEREVLALRELQQLAMRDPLTNAFNRRACELALQVELNRSQRHGTPVCVAFIDVDRFKDINDTHGHGAGDLILRDLAQCVERNKRNYDVFGRWGGDEFLLILPDTDLECSAQLVARIRDCAAQDLPDVTLSFGIGVHSAGDTAAELVSKADAAVYQSKHRGGDTVTLSRAV